MPETPFKHARPIIFQQLSKKYLLTISNIIYKNYVKAFFNSQSLY